MTGRVDEDYIYDIVIFDKTSQLDRRVITAGRARVIQNAEQPDVITLEMQDVWSQLIDAREHQRFEYSQAESMRYNLLIKPFSVNVSLGPMEKTAADILKIIAEKETEFARQKRQLALQTRAQLLNMRGEIRYLSESDSLSVSTLRRDRGRIENLYANYRSLHSRVLRNAELNRYLLELHRKFAFPFSCLVFVVFTFPVGLMARRSGRIFGFGIGLFASAVYWALLLIGHEMGFNQGYSPFIAMWAPNLVIFAAGVALNIVRIRR
jgi:lipopolysaccharide export LptBFGC system permease protein LptF